MVAIAKQLQGHKRQLQHKVTTGTKLVMGLDGRTSDARRFRDLCAGLIEEAGPRANAIRVAASAPSLDGHGKRLSGYRLKQSWGS